MPFCKSMLIIMKLLQKANGKTKKRQRSRKYIDLTIKTHHRIKRKRFKMITKKIKTHQHTLKGYT